MKQIENITLIEKYEGGGIMNLDRRTLSFTVSKPTQTIAGIERRFVRLAREDGTISLIPHTNVPLKSGTTGNILCTAMELTQFLIGYSDDEICWLANGYSLKSMAYIKKELESIAFVRTSFSPDGTGEQIELKNERYLQGFLNGQVYAGSYEDMYAIQIHQQPDIDSFSITTHLFNAEVGIWGLQVVFAAEQFARILAKRKYEENIKCRECGAIMHWTETCVDGLVEKVKAFEEQYCGCGDCL